MNCEFSNINFIETANIFEIEKDESQTDLYNDSFECKLENVIVTEMNIGKGNDLKENRDNIEKCVENGEAYKKFIELVENQGGDTTYCLNTDKFSKQ